MKVVSIVVVIFAFAIIFLFASSEQLNVVSYSIKSDKIKNAVKMAFIADYHSCGYGEGQSILLKEINQQKPDVVLLGGDIFDDRLPHDNAKELLLSLSTLYPCFYVSGNHEVRSGDLDQIKKTIHQYGITVLEGEAVSFDVNGQTLTICGIDDPDIGEDSFQKQLENCGQCIKKSIFTILLSHRPERIDSYRLYTFDLILAGHAHGGQWRIPGILNGLIAPNQGVLPKYAGGLYKFQNTSMIVSRGLAKESTRVPRIFNRPELVIIDVTPLK